MRLFGWRCNKVLPTVYDESLSYYEVICKLTKRVMELEEKVAPYVHNLTVTSTVDGDDVEVYFQIISSKSEELSSDEVLRVMGEQGFNATKLLGCSGYGDGGKIALGAYVSDDGLVVKYADSDGTSTWTIGTFTTKDVVV